MKKGWGLKMIKTGEEIKEEIRENNKRLQEISHIIHKNNLVKEGLSPAKLCNILEELGPTFVKLGQIMSKRNDILPKEYCVELEKLCENSKPLPALEIIDVIESEFGRPIDEIFASFEEKPLGSASIGQVHRATLPDGKEVVVKVQRPGVYTTMKEDIGIMRKIAKPLKFAPSVGGVVDFHSLIEEFWKVSMQELDFTIEAEHTRMFYKNNEDVPGIRCPIIEDSLTTSRVMTMEFVKGFSIGNVDKLDEINVDRDELGTRLTKNYIKQVLGDGLFHADPHQGNIFYSDGDIVWIDMGMVGIFSTNERNIIKEGVWAIVQGDIPGIITALTSLGAVKSDDFNYTKLYNDLDILLSRYMKADLGELNMGTLLEEIIKVMNDNNIKLPSNISMLARGLITVEGVIGLISPNVNAIEIAKDYITKDMLRNHEFAKGIKKDIKSGVVSAEKAIEIPGLTSDLLKTTLKGQTRINLDLSSSKQLVDSFNRTINNLNICIITAALLLASSLICTTDMNPKILGIPALGFIGYVAAVVLGIFLLIKAKKQK